MPPIQHIRHCQIPDRLNYIHPSLKRLFCLGDLPQIENFKCLAIVGSRRHSDQAKIICQKLIIGLKGYPIIIISGLAIGIDSLAHEEAIENNILTIAVPGSGLNEDVLYPRQKLPLARKIIESGGCLISEFKPDTRAAPWTFPERNRIMAGLCDAVLVIEAERKSGTLITAKLALEYNKSVMAVPSCILSPLSEGPNYLLKEGAKVITCSKDIIEELGLVWHEDLKIEEQNLFSESSDEEKAILSLLPLGRDEIFQKIKMPIHLISTTLSILELKGLIKEQSGKFYFYSNTV